MTQQPTMCDLFYLHFNILASVQQWTKIFHLLDRVRLSSQKSSTYIVTVSLHKN